MSKYWHQSTQRGEFFCADGERKEVKWRFCEEGEKLEWSLSENLTGQQHGDFIESSIVKHVTADGAQEQ